MLQRLALTMLLSLLVGGCAASPRLYLETQVPLEREALVSALKIAVVPLENLTNREGAGKILAELLYTELAGRGYQLIPPQEVSAAVALHNFDMERISADQAVKLGRSLNADAVLLGSVSEYGYQYGLREEPAAAANLRLVRISDESVLWAASGGGVGRGIIGRDSLAMLAQEVAARLVSGLATAR